MAEVSDIPWEAAKELAERFDQDYIVALLWSAETNTETVLTWGRTLDQSDGAANFGNSLKEKLGWDPDECTAASAKVLELAAMAHNLVKHTSFLVEKIYENSLDDQLPVSLPPVAASLNQLKSALNNWRVSQ